MLKKQKGGVMKGYTNREERGKMKEEREKVKFKIAKLRNDYTL